MIRQINIKYIL